MAKLILGCGYLGLRVARLWRAAGETVFAVTRSSQRAGELLAAGIEPIVGDLMSATQIPLPQGVRTVLFAVGHGRDSSHSIYDLYVGAVGHAIAWLPDSIERFIYVSSTGVYGQVTGQEVDEQTICRPTR